MLSLRQWLFLLFVLFALIGGAGEAVAFFWLRDATVALERQQRGLSFHAELETFHIKLLEALLLGRAPSRRPSQRSNGGAKPLFDWLEQRAKLCDSCHKREKVGLKVDVAMTEMRIFVDSSDAWKGTDPTSKEVFLNEHVALFQLLSKLEDATERMVAHVWGEQSASGRAAINILNNVETVLISFLATSLFLAAVLASVISRRISKPIRDWVSTARQIGQGDLSVRVEVPTIPELGQLAHAQNEMVRKLQEHEEKAVGEAVIHEKAIALEQRNRGLKEINDKLRDAQSLMIRQERLAAVGAVATGVAHEINNPLTYMVANVSLLRHYVDTTRVVLQKYREAVAGDINADTAQKLVAFEAEKKFQHLDNEMDEVISDLHLGTDEIKNVVADMTLFAHKGADRAERLNLNAVITSAIKIANHEIKTIAVVETSFAELPEITAFEDRLRHVFLNLLVNAAHAVAEGKATRKEIWISTRVVGDQIVVEVTDTGCGIAPELLEQVFDPFFTTKSESQGTGLGLSISAETVRQHGGHMELSSEFGAGSTFKVLLPIETGLDINNEAANPNAIAE